jgi:hypothetical protein
MATTDPLGKKIPTSGFRTNAKIATLIRIILALFMGADTPYGVKLLVCHSPQHLVFQNYRRSSFHSEAFFKTARKRTL